MRLGPMRSLRLAGYSALTALALLSPGRALAAGEVSGRISGVVLVEGTSDGLAGVTLSVQSPSLPGGKQTTTTDDNGNYQLQNLPAGVYELTATVEGFTPIRQRNIQVNAGQGAAVDIRLQVQTGPTETIKVIEKTIGLPPGGALDIRVFGDADCVQGRLEIVQYEGAKSADLYPRARPPARGLLSVTYVVADVAAILARATPKPRGGAAETPVVPAPAAQAAPHAPQPSRPTWMGSSRWNRFLPPASRHCCLRSSRRCWRCEQASSGRPRSRKFRRWQTRFPRSWTEPKPHSHPTKAATGPPFSAR